MIVTVDSSRLSAIKILNALLSQQGSLSVLLDRHGQAQTPEKRALLQALCFGLCRHYEQLAFIADQFLDKPLRAKDRDVYCLLLIGIYQLFFMRMPDYAVVNECVECCKSLKKPWAKNLVNAVLRSVQREADTLQNRIEQAPALKYSMPLWLLELLQQDWPDAFNDILAASMQQAPMTLRVNQQKISVSLYQQQLKAAGITAKPGALTQYSLLLDQPLAVDSLPGFAAGLVSVQDEASQLAAELLQPQNGEHILDACAAPGGKTCAMLEWAPEALIDAVDSDQNRLQRVQDNLQRINQHAALICADINTHARGLQSQNSHYDRILLDVPCSATGVIRRHPDIKLLRRPDDIERLIRQQADILDAVWPLLKQGGLLLYSTCSVLRRENSQQIENFLPRTPDADEVLIAADWGRACTVGRQLFPTPGSHDGFYYALLQKC